MTDMSKGGTPRTILIVDDERDLVRLLKMNLERYGWQIFSAYDGDAGLKLAHQLKPDLIIMDINMPVKSGIQCYQELCTEHGRPKYPVLIMTARDDLKDTFEGIDADGFISKPFEIEELHRAIEQILARNSALHVCLMDAKTNTACAEITQFLERERYRVTITESLPTLEHLTQTAIPDFVLIEYMQKDLNGSDVIQGVQKLFSERRHVVPVIVYSYSGLDYGEKSLEAGADRYIGKPKDYAEIVTVLREFELRNK